MIKKGFWAVFVLLLVLFGLNLMTTGSSFLNNGVKVAQTEFKPEAMLRKYEWFKDAAAGLDAKKHSIAIYEAKLLPLREMQRKDMDRTDKEQLGQWEAEVAGVRASYNNLVAEWNAQISKFNWAPFVGDLPAGASQTLSKEYAPYE